MTALVDDVTGASARFSSSTCMESGFKGDSVPLLDASTSMDSGLLVAIKAGSAVIVDDAGSEVAVGGTGNLVTLVSWPGTKSWLVVRGAGGLASIVPFREAESTVDSTPGAEKAISCEGGSAGSTDSDAGEGCEDAANGEGVLELTTPMV